MEHGFFRVLSRPGFLELLRRFPAVGSQTVPLAQAFGRVLARDIPAPEDLPLADRSCMDGYAVRAADLFGASETGPTQLACVAEIAVDACPDFELLPGQCAWIPTGGCLPRGADAVLMVEFSQDLGAGIVEMRKAVAPGEYVMQRGEDARAGEPALPAGTRLRAQEIGLLAALGVALISTGDEVLPVEAQVRPGQIRDVNAHALSCLVQEFGGEPVACGIVKDELALLVRGHPVGAGVLRPGAALRRQLGGRARPDHAGPGQLAGQRGPGPRRGHEPGQADHPGPPGPKTLSGPARADRLGPGGHARAGPAAGPAPGRGRRRLRREPAPHPARRTLAQSGLEARPRGLRACADRGRGRAAAAGRAGARQVPGCCAPCSTARA